MATTTWANLPADKRDRVLAAAREEFARAGYQSGSLNAIASAAAIAKGSLFQYFDDKRDLFETVVGHNARRIAAATIDQIDPGLPFFELLTDLIRRWIDYFVANPAAFALSQAVAQSGDQRVTNAARQSSADAFRGALLPPIDAAIERGELRADVDPDLVLSTLVMVLRHTRTATLEPLYDPGLDWSAAPVSDRHDDRDDGDPVVRYVEVVRWAFGASP